MFLYKKIELLFLRKWELLFLKRTERTGILIFESCSKRCYFSLKFSKNVYIGFLVIILHFITGLKLLISPKVDKQLSIISLNRGTNTRGSSPTSRVVQESCEFRAQPARPESVPSHFPTGIRHHTPAVVYVTTRLMMT